MAIDWKQTYDCLIFVGFSHELRRCRVQEFHTEVVARLHSEAAVDSELRGLVLIGQQRQVDRKADHCGQRRYDDQRQSGERTAATRNSATLPLLSAGPRARRRGTGRVKVVVRLHVVVVQRCGTVAVDTGSGVTALVIMAIAGLVEAAVPHQIRVFVARVGRRIWQVVLREVTRRQHRSGRRSKTEHLL